MRRIVYYGDREGCSNEHDPFVAMLVPHPPHLARCDAGAAADCSEFSVRELLDLRFVVRHAAVLRKSRHAPDMRRLRSLCCCMPHWAGLRIRLSTSFGAEPALRSAIRRSGSASRLRSLC